MSYIDDPAYFRRKVAERAAAIDEQALRDWIALLAKYRWAPRPRLEPYQRALLARGQRA